MRRGNGVGREYLYVFDLTGGDSGPGIKTFVSENVGQIQNTEMPFVPRSEIQLKKAGGSQIAGSFVRAAGEGCPA